MEAATSATTFRPCHSSGITGSGGALVRLTSARDLVGGVGGPLAERPQKVERVLGRIEHRSAIDHRAKRVEVELESGHDPEVAATTAQPVQQVGVLGLARADEPPVGGDHVGGHQVVAGEPELAHRPTDPAAERESGHTGARHEAARRGEAVGLRLVIHVSPHRAAADLGAPGHRIDVDVAHVREVDDDAVVTGREARDAVAAAAHGEGQAMAACEADRGDHIGGAGALHDDRGPAVLISCRSRPDMPLRNRRRPV